MESRKSCHSVNPCYLDMVRFPVLRHIEPQAPLPVVVWVETTSGSSAMSYQEKKW